jgi:polar amino acid transport system substrate-binding protein
VQEHPYPPYGDPENPNSGLGLEIMRAAFKTQGHDMTMEYVPWAQADSSVNNGTYDIVPFTWRTDARVQVLLFSTASATSTVRYIKRKGDRFEIKSPESLNRMRIGTVPGYS